MSKFKNNPNIELFYTDTDSYFFKGEFPEDMIGKDIGQFKLEYLLNEAVFLGPKIYGGITSDNKYICKIKGFKNPNLISFEDLKSLLIKDTRPLILNHEKWFRSLNNSNITIKEQIYSLIATENKRSIVYENNVAVNTQPFIVKDNIIIDKP